MSGTSILFSKSKKGTSTRSFQESSLTKPWLKPSRQWFEALLNFLHSFYQVFLRQIFGNACKYEPTCSHYARQALSTHRLHKALFLVTWRLLRCQPFSSGGFDPVPKNNKDI